MNDSDAVIDSRKPSPPFGYSRVCSHALDKQIDIVALFHANRIKPARIAYRVGIDLDLIEKLISGSLYQQQFKSLLAKHRRARRNQRLKASTKIIGIRQTELQMQIEQEFQESQQQ